MAAAGPSPAFCLRGCRHCKEGAGEWEADSSPRARTQGIPPRPAARRGSRDDGNPDSWQNQSGFHQDGAFLQVSTRPLFPLPPPTMGCSSVQGEGKKQEPGTQDWRQPSLLNLGLQGLRRPQRGSWRCPHLNTRGTGAGRFSCAHSPCHQVRDSFFIEITFFYFKNYIHLYLQKKKSKQNPSAERESFSPARQCLCILDFFFSITNGTR